MLGDRWGIIMILRWLAGIWRCEGALRKAPWACSTVGATSSVRLAYAERAVSAVQGGLQGWLEACGPWVVALPAAGRFGAGKKKKKRERKKKK